MAHMLVVALGVSCREPFGELAVLRGEIAHVCDLLWAMGTSKESGEALEVEIEQAEPNQKDDLMVSRGAHFASWSFPPFKGQLHNVRCMIGTQQDANAQAFEMLSFRSPFLHDVGAPDLVDLVIKAARKSFQDEDFGVLLPALERIEQLKVTALVEIPWSEYGVELHQKYPVREKQGWFRSYWEHFRWGALLPPPPFSSFPISQPLPLTVLYQPFAQYWRLVSQRLGCGAITRFPPWIVSADEKQRCLHGFDEHIERLKKAVAPEKLLIYNILDGWDPLCHFLELPVPVGMPFPREDSYSVLHWRSDPVTFLSFVYLCYGLYCLFLSRLFVRLLSQCR